MSGAVLMLNRVTLVSLTGAGQPSLLPPLFRTASESLSIPLCSETAAQRAILAARIDSAVARADHAVLLVAQGVGCLAAAWWGRLSPRPYVERVAGALMVAPVARNDRAGPFTSPRSVLPFPSLVIGADDTAQLLAGEWGSRLVDGPLTTAHHKPSSRLQGIVARFTASIVERDVQAAERLLAAIGDK